MTRPKMIAPAADAPPDAIIDLLQNGLDLLEDERAAFLGGEYNRIPAISDRKSRLLSDLEQFLPPPERSKTAEQMLAALVEMSRRNEDIIKAARQGLSHARRRIRSIKQADHGVVAYDESGADIACTADRLRRDRTA